MDITHVDPGAFMSQATALGNMVFVAGQVADDTNLGIAGQTRQVLDKIDRHLAAAGTDRARLLFAQIFLRDISTWSQMNDVWSAWIAGNVPPARATVEAKLAGEGYLVEIVVFAARTE